MQGIINFLTFIKDNWTLIITIIGLIIWLVEKIKKYLSLSKEDKINLALSNAKAIALSLVTKAEDTYGSNTGRIKRSEVISELLKQCPELKQMATQEELEARLDGIINDALEDMKKILATKESKEKEKTETITVE